MSTTFPVSVRIAPLPSNGVWTPQTYAVALQDRITLVSTDDVAVFQIGTQLPTSDQGPFLLNGVSWYVWDVGTGAYIPQIIPFESLRYIAQQTAPDPSKYVLWIVTDVSGSPTDLRYYVGSPTNSWVSVFSATLSNYSTTDEMNAAIDAATGNVADKKLARAYPAVGQNVGTNGSYAKVNLGSESFDPSNAFNTSNSRYTVPVSGYYRVSYYLQIDNSTGTSSGMEINAYVGSNGGVNVGGVSGTAVASPPGDRWYVSATDIIQQPAGAYIELFVRSSDGVGSGQVTVSTNSYFSVELVQET